MRAGAQRSTVGRMRILIVDEHEVYRAACGALLRTEGVEVADAGPGQAVIGLADSFKPEIVILDAAPPADELRVTARQLQSLPSAPAVVLTSSAGEDRIDPGLAALRFIAKADICAAAIALAIADVTDEPAERHESE